VATTRLTTMDRSFRLFTHPPVSAHSGDRPALFRLECLTILALSRERRESQLAKSGNRSAPLVGLQRRVSPRAPIVYPSHSKEGLFEPAAS